VHAVPIDRGEFETAVVRRYCDSFPNCRLIRIYQHIAPLTTLQLLRPMLPRVLLQAVWISDGSRHLLLKLIIGR
jgi:hypothetical protein